jgi:hypothetical protein
MIVKACVTLVLLIVFSAVSAGLTTYLQPLETTAALSQAADGALYQQTKDLVGWARVCLYVMFAVAFSMLWIREIDALVSRFFGMFK